MSTAPAPAPPHHTNFKKLFDSSPSRAPFIYYPRGGGKMLEKGIY